MDTVDAVVVGLGSAGSAAAAFLAEAGLSVVGLDRAPLDRAGAQWCNGVPAWAYEAAELEPPEPPELRASAGGTTWLVAGWGLARQAMRGHRVLEIDMRHLTARLQRQAVAAGARLQGERTVTAVDPDGTVHTDDGPVRGRVVVDAAGGRGPGLAGRRPVPPERMCTASQQTRVITDPDAAAAWFRSQGAAPGDIVCFTSVAGGYSIVHVRWHGEHEVGLLTGSVPASGVPASRVLLERFVAEQPWIGPVRFGGHRAIPLGPPRRDLVSGPVVRLGDAAGQVYAAHGSGVGQHLVAARVLARALAAGEGPEGYARRWTRTWAPELASSWVFSAFAQGLSAEDLATLMRAGLLDAEVSRHTMEQRPARIDAAALARLGRAATRAPGAAARLLPTLARMGLTKAAWAAWPGLADRLTP